MEIKNFEDYIEKRYNGQLKYYDSVSVKNKKRYKKFQWTLIILSTLTTVLAALPASIKTLLGPFEPHYAVVITAAIVTILTSAINTFQYQELWANYRSTKELLNPEIFKYLFNIDDYQGKSEEEKKSIFVKNVETILGNEHTNWSVLKKASASSAQSQNDDAQNKLKERINTKKIVQPEETTNTEQKEEVTNIVQPGESVENTEDVTGENKNDEPGNK